MVEIDNNALSLDNKQNAIYKLLFDRIRKADFIADTDSAFYHGQILFACEIGLITSKQAYALSNMIPEY